MMEPWGVNHFLRIHAEVHNVDNRFELYWSTDSCGSDSFPEDSPYYMKDMLPPALAVPFLRGFDRFVASVTAGIAPRPGRPLPGQDSLLLDQRAFNHGAPGPLQRYRPGRETRVRCRGEAAGCRISWRFLLGTGYLPAPSLFEIGQALNRALMNITRFQSTVGIGLAADWKCQRSTTVPEP